ncbi:MAG: mechanosensitive ion channel [Campylobacteraceae bacterium]|nr:mechanosensitive ion channel [Campylobacteraceae bacterium]
MEQLGLEITSFKNLDYVGFAMLCGKYAIRFIVSLLIFFVGKWIIGKLSFIIEKVISRIKIDPMLAGFLLNIIKTLLFIFVVLAALSNLGIETTSFIAVLGAVGLAIGMSFKDTFSNIGAGVLIIFFRPFKLGDFIEINGVSGRAGEINLFSTLIHTSDNRTIIMPNSQVIANRIINYSLQEFRRVDLVFGIEYSEDIKKVRELIIQTANANPAVLRAPEAPADPFVGVLEFADSSINLTVRCWVRTPNYWNAYFELNEEIKNTFDKNGINIPFPQVVYHAQDGSTSPAPILPGKTPTLPQ